MQSTCPYLSLKELLRLRLRFPLDLLRELATRDTVKQLKATPLNLGQAQCCHYHLLFRAVRPPVTAIIWTTSWPPPVIAATSGPPPPIIVIVTIIARWASRGPSFLWLHLTRCWNYSSQDLQKCKVRNKESKSLTVYDVQYIFASNKHEKHVKNLKAQLSEITMLERDLDETRRTRRHGGVFTPSCDLA